MKTSRIVVFCSWLQITLLAGSISEQRGVWASIQGNTQVAMAQLDDQEMFDQIVSELSNKTAYEAVRKLELSAASPRSMP